MVWVRVSSVIPWTVWIGGFQTRGIRVIVYIR